MSGFHLSLSHQTWPVNVEKKRLKNVLVVWRAIKWEKSLQIYLPPTCELLKSENLSFHKVQMRQNK